MYTVIFQTALLWAAVIWIYVLASRRDGRAPIDDIGVFWLGIFALYATLPQLSWLLLGTPYGLLAGRLFELEPTVSEEVYLMNIALAYVIGFSAIYLVLLKRVGRPSAAALAKIGREKIAGAVVIVAAAFLIGAVISGLGLVRSAESYGDSYLVMAELPLGLRQLIRVTGGFSSVAILVLLAAVFQRWPRYRWVLVLYLLSILFSIDPEGSRTGVALGVLSVVVAWHTLVRPIPTGRLVVGGFLGLMAFLFLGLWRGVGASPSISDLVRAVSGGGGEFVFLWSNAVDLLRAKQDAGISIPFSTRFSELFSFIPSQLLWFEKSSLSIWFLETYYPAFKEIGGGMAFGAVSQAVIGWGIFEALVRGAILGFLAGKLMKWFRTPSGVWWRFPLQLYILVNVYQAVRDTTFSQWGGVVQTVLPALVIIGVLGAMLSKRRVPVAPAAGRAAGGQGGS